MVWWSVACALHGFAVGFGLLLVARFLLGMGEGGGFPAAARVVSEWIAPEDRSTAVGIINFSGNGGREVGAGGASGGADCADAGVACGVLGGGRAGDGVGGLVGGFVSRQCGRGVVGDGAGAGVGAGADVWRDGGDGQRAGGGVCEVYERFGVVLSAVLAAEVPV